jgi:uncharacterized protein (DUF934 family)
MPALIEIERRGGSLRLRQRTVTDLELLTADDWQPESRAGLLLAVDAEPAPRFADASLIAIDFPVFHDGRGLSLAVLLRTRVGFDGELCAVGDVHPELLHYLHRCGFDSFLLPEARALGADDPRLAPHADYYQASVAETLPAFRRNRRGSHFRHH